MQAYTLPGDCANRVRVAIPSPACPASLPPRPPRDRPAAALSEPRERARIRKRPAPVGAGRWGWRSEFRHALRTVAAILGSGWLIGQPTAAHPATGRLASERLASHGNVGRDTRHNVGLLAHGQTVQVIAAEPVTERPALPPARARLDHVELPRAILGTRQRVVPVGDGRRGGDGGSASRAGSD